MNNADIHDSTSFFPIYVRTSFQNEGKLSQLKKKFLPRSSIFSIGGCKSTQKYLTIALTLILAHIENGNWVRQKIFDKIELPQIG